MKVIQMVVKSEDSSLFLIDYDEESGELTFRSSRNPQYRQVEKVVIKDDLVYTNLHHFHIGFLQQLIKTNEK